MNVCENVNIWTHLTEPDLLEIRLSLLGISAKQHRWFAFVKTTVIWIPVTFGLRKFCLPNMIWHHLHIMELYCNIKHSLDCEGSKGYKEKDYKEGKMRKVHVEVLIVVTTVGNVLQWIHALVCRTDLQPVISRELQAPRRTNPLHFSSNCGSNSTSYHSKFRID